MKKNILKILIPIILLATHGCNEPNSPNVIDYKNSVLFNLVVNKENQEIYIYSTITYPFDSKANNVISKTFVKDAMISLHGHQVSINNFSVSGSASHISNYKGFYYTNNEELLLQTDSNYILKITIGNETITGSTQAPEDFTILKPYSNVVIEENDKLIKWSKSNSAYGYIGKITRSFIVEFPDTNFNVNDEHSFITQDTFFISPVELFGKDKIEINIWAYDENYHNYINNKDLTVGLDGAYGYFGSSVLKTVTIEIE